jgi:outer membrane protein
MCAPAICRYCWWPPVCCSWPFRASAPLPAVASLGYNDRAAPAASTIHHHTKEPTMKQRLAMGMFAVLLASGPLQAQDNLPGNLKIGYVDVRAVLAESKSGKQFRAELDKFVKDKQAALKKEEEKLVGLRQSLEKEALTLSDAQKQEKQKSFQEKVQALQKMAQEADRELRQKDAEFTNKALQTIREIIGEVAKEEKVNLVLSRNEVLYGDEAMNLTAKVSEKFDARSDTGKKKNKKK